MTFRQIKSFDLSEYAFEAEESEEYQQLAKDASILKEIFHDINNIVHQGREPLEDIDSKIEDVIENVEHGNNHLEKALTSKRLKTSITIIGITSVVGLIVGLPLGGVGAIGVAGAVGAYITGGLIVSGAVAGGIAGTGGGFGIGCLTNKIRNINKNSN